MLRRYTMTDAAAIQVLTNLLQQAANSALITERHRGFQISVREYHSLLRSYRNSHSLENRYHVHRFQPTTQNIAVQQEILGILKSVLEPHLQDDMLQSAQIVTGGAISGFHINELLEHLLSITIARGAEYAAKNFYKCVENSSVNIHSITMIDGVTIENPIEVSEGIRLVPIPNDAREFPPYIHTSFFEPITNYYGSTLIVVDETVSPVFARPDELSPTNPRGPFVRSDVNTEYPNFVEENFCEALSLSINHSVNYVSWWSHIDPDETYAVRFRGDGSGWVQHTFHNSKIQINEQDVREAMSLYVTKKNLNQKVAQKLRVPIDRWKQSKTDQNPVDIFINLGTAPGRLHLNWVNASKCFRILLQVGIRHKVVFEWWHVGGKSESFRRLRACAAATSDRDPAI